MPCVSDWRNEKLLTVCPEWRHVTVEDEHSQGVVEAAKLSRLQRAPLARDTLQTQHRCRHKHNFINVTLVELQTQHYKHNTGGGTNTTLQT